MPRLRLRPGAGYAIVTFTRWSIVIVGAALTLAALGIDMAKVTLLAGALGVGIGFGLQNVVNNFVSGLILIVERPVGVGDVIESRRADRARSSASAFAPPSCARGRARRSSCPTPTWCRRKW